MTGLEVFVFENNGERHIAIHGARCTWSFDCAVELHTRLEEALRRAQDPTPLPIIEPPLPRLHTPTPQPTAEDLS